LWLLVALVAVVVMQVITGVAVALVVINQAQHL
jgi:hypothetical protein